MKTESALTDGNGLYDGTGFIVGSPGFESTRLTDGNDLFNGAGFILGPPEFKSTRLTDCDDLRDGAGFIVACGYQAACNSPIDGTGRWLLLPRGE